MSELSRVHNVIYGEPWAIVESWHGTIGEIYSAKIAGLNTEDKIAEAISTAAEKQVQRDTSRLPYDLRGDVAIIPLDGPLVPKANLLTNVSGATSMQSFANAFTRAMNDESVASIIPHVSSPGGSVQGMFETANVVRDARGKKPIVAFIDGIGASAAYLIASQADEVWCSVGATVGSLAIMLQTESDDRLKKNIGVDSTIIRSKELKAPGAGGVTPSQMGAMHRRVMQLDSMLMEAISSARPRMDMSKAANGDIYTGRHALEVGLVDGITTLDKLVNSLS